MIGVMRFRLISIYYLNQRAGKFFFFLNQKIKEL